MDKISLARVREYIDLPPRQIYPLSPVALYLEKEQCLPGKKVTLNQLCDLISNLAYAKGCYDYGNPEVFLADADLQQALGPKTFVDEELPSLLEPHFHEDSNHERVNIFGETFWPPTTDWYDPEEPSPLRTKNVVLELNRTTLYTARFAAHPEVTSYLLQEGCRGIDNPHSFKYEDIRRAVYEFLNRSRDHHRLVDFRSPNIFVVPTNVLGKRAGVKAFHYKQIPLIIGKLIRQR